MDGYIRVPKRTLLVTLMATLVTATFAAVAPVASAEGLVPFHAAYLEHVTFVPCPSGTPPTVLCVSILGLGQATHLGNSMEIDTGGIRGHLYRRDNRLCDRTG
jgi:hypothetical protein